MMGDRRLRITCRSIQFDPDIEMFRTANSYRSLHTDRFTRDYYARDIAGLQKTILARVSLKVTSWYESAYWSMVTDLRSAGHLDDGSFGRLLDRVARPRASRRSRLSAPQAGRGMPAPGVGVPAQRVAESRPGSSARSVSQESAAEAVRVAERGLGRRAAWGAVRMPMEVPDDYPRLEADDIRACIAYAHAAIADDTLAAVSVARR